MSPLPLPPAPLAPPSFRSGPGEVQELEVGTDGASLKRLLSFLTMSFNGGTDVNAPLALSLNRVAQARTPAGGRRGPGRHLAGLLASSAIALGMQHQFVEPPCTTYVMQALLQVIPAQED